MTDPYSTARDNILALHRRGGADVFETILALDKASSIGEGVRKNAGVVYTPKNIALDMCALAKPSLDETVFEPSCGRGVFIFALAEHHLQKFAPDLVCSKLSANLAACDIDPKAIEDLHALWTDYWIIKGVGSAPALRALCEDSLLGALSQLKFDLALGNPPYVRFQNLPQTQREELQKRFATCKKGNVDLFFAFVEQSLVQCSRSCMIFPNSWLSTTSGKQLRIFLAPRIQKIADFGDQLVFDPVRAYVCIALATRSERPASEPMRIQTTGLDLAEPWTDLLAGDPRISAARWTLSASSTSSSAIKGKTLGDIATLYSGIATLSDSSYAIADGTISGTDISFTDPKTSKPMSIPLEFAPKKIKLTKVASEADLLASADRILFPYKADGTLLPFSTIESDHKDMADFLSVRKERLAERDKGAQDDYPEWHAYGRKQGLKNIPAGELCAVPTMSQGAIQCFSFDATKTGRFLFTSGFILAPKPGHTCSDIIQALSSTESWQWALSHGKPWAGSDGKTYRSYGARLLLSMPLPN